MRRSGRHSHLTPASQFSRARIYKLLRYPSVKDVRCLPRPLHLSLASPRVHIPLGLSWLSFLAAPRLTESPLVSSSGTTSRLAATSPRQQRCANSSSKRQALTPLAGLRHDKLAIKIACPIAVGRSSWPHPLCTDTAFSPRLLSRRYFRVAQIRKEASS